MDDGRHVDLRIVTRVQSSFFAVRTRFPEGSIEFDHALVMRDLPHEWHQAEDPCRASG